MKTIDINYDLGEGLGNEEVIMPFISSANIACGYHAGDENTIWQTVELCIKHKVAIGAHPSFYDKKNFGRTELKQDAEDIYDIVTQQLIILDEIVTELEASVHHVKPHGALYNLSAKDKTVAAAIANAVKDFDHNLILFGLSGSCSISEAEKVGIKTCNEVFADRAYSDDGSLMPRTNDGAVITDVNKSVKQAIQLVKKGRVTTATGKNIKLNAESICIHGDGMHAVEFVKAIFNEFNKEGVVIKPC